MYIMYSSVWIVAFLNYIDYKKNTRKKVEKAFFFLSCKEKEGNCMYMKSKIAALLVSLLITVSIMADCPSDKAFFLCLMVLVLLVIMWEMLKLLKGLVRKFVRIALLFPVRMKKP